MTHHEQHPRRQDELRARLAAADPARPGGPAHAVDESPAVVSTRIEEAVMTTRVTHNPTRSSGDGSGARPNASRSRWLAAAAAIVLVTAAAAAAVVGGVGDEARDSRSGRTVALTVPGADTMASCLPFDVGFLREMPLAFSGTATAVTDDEVALEVDRWYKAGPTQREAASVTLSVPGGAASVALDGVEFTEGERYLVTATDGQVNGCGFSGPATPELTAAYQKAFTD